MLPAQRQPGTATNANDACRGAAPQSCGTGYQPVHPSSVPLMHDAADPPTPIAAASCPPQRSSMAEPFAVARDNGVERAGSIPAAAFDGTAARVPAPLPVSLSDAAGVGPGNSPAPAALSSSLELSDLSAAQLDALLDRQRLVEDWLVYWSQRKGSVGVEHAAVAFAAAVGRDLSGRTLRRWAAAYSRGGLDALRDRRGRPARDRAQRDAATTPAAWDLFRAYYLAPQRRSIRLCYELVAGEAPRSGWAWPAYDTIVRRVREELPDFQADYYRLGPEQWERKHAPRIQRDYSIYRPNQLWVGDHHQFDLVALSGGRPLRPWLTAWMDMRSRKFVGWWIGESPASDSIFAAFRAGAQAHGVPLEILADNGKDYRSVDFAGGKRVRVQFDESRTADLMNRLGVQVHWARAYSPQSKPIESAFKTVCENFSKLFASWCGNKPETRPESFYADLRSGNIDVPAIEQVRELWAQWVADVYHRRPHSGDGMDGRTPDEVFALDPIAKRTAPADVLDRLLCRHVPATVTKKGVRYRGVYYGQSNPAVWTMQGRQVLLAIDELDAARVVVCDLEGRPLTVAENHALRGATADDVREGARRQKSARKLAAAALPALAAARQTTTEHALAALAARHGAETTTVAATGTDDARPVALLPCGAGFQPASCGAGFQPAGDEPAALLALRFDEPDDGPADSAVLTTALNFDEPDGAAADDEPLQLLFDDEPADAVAHGLPRLEADA